MGYSSPSRSSILKYRTFVNSEDEFNNRVRVSASSMEIGFGIYAPSADSATFYHSADFTNIGMYNLLPYMNCDTNLVNQKDLEWRD